MSITAIAVIEQKGLTALQQAAALVITTHDGYVVALEQKKLLKAISNEIDDTFDPVIDAAHKSHKEALAAKAKHSGPVKQAMTILTNKTTAWDQEQERARQAKERRLRELARQQEEARRLEEAQAREEESRKARAEQERQRKIAEEMAAKGRTEEAERARVAAEQARLEAEAAIEESEAALNDAVSAPTPVVFVPKSTPVVLGISYSDNWVGVVDDLLEVAKAVVAGRLPVSAIMAHQPTFTKLAGSLQQTVSVNGWHAVNNRVQRTRP